MWIAKYIDTATTTNKTYYRTIYADDVNEATRNAERFANKGYTLATVIRRNGN